MLKITVNKECENLKDMIITTMANIEDKRGTIDDILGLMIT